MLFTIFFFISISIASKYDEIILLPATYDGKLYYEVNKEQISSSNTILGKLCFQRDFPKSFEFPEGIDEISIVSKRVVADVHQFSSVVELNPEYDSNTYVVVGNTKNEELAHDLLFNLTQFDIVRFGKVNTKIYDPIENVFYGINENLEHPNGYFYSTNQVNNDYVKEMPIESIFNLTYLESVNTQFDANRDADIITRVKTQLYRNMKELRNEWKFEEDIKGKRFYMKLKINAKEKNYEYCEINSFNRQYLPLKYPSKEDEYNRNLYFLNTCGVDYFTHQKTCKFTRFTERGKENEMIDIGMLTYTESMPMYLQRLSGEGSHLTTEVTMFNYNTTEQHEMYMVYTVPQGMFIDKYQMEELSRKEKKFEVFMYEPMDLEAPILTGRQAHVILKYLKNDQTISSFKIPIHLRYHKASATQMYEEDSIFAPPEIFQLCNGNTNCTRIKALDSLRKNEMKGYYHTTYSCSISSPEQFISPICEKQIPFYKIPVGQLNEFDNVTKITLGITLISSIIILLCLIVF